MLNALVAGQADPQTMADLAKGRLRQKLPELQQALSERLSPIELALQRLGTIPGVKRKTAELILAEIGTDMSRFPTAKHLASWAGLCRGNRESAGKRYLGKTRKGSRWLKSGLVEAALAAARTRNTAVSAQYHRLKLRRGTKRAAAAVARALLVIADHLLKDETTYRERVRTSSDLQDRAQLCQHLTRCLERLGFKVSLESTSLTSSIA